MKELLSRKKWQYLFYTCSHPSDGFYWIRHQEKGSVPIALLMVLLFSLTFSLNRMYASFVVNTVNPQTVNSLTELIAVLALYMILCVGNWSITCLMDGEGRFKDIVIAVGYAMLPLIVSFALATVLSQAVAENEEAFYTLILVAGITYAAVMMLIGIMQVHNYTFGKTLGTLLLTLLAVFIILFLIMLVFHFISQVITFFESIYTELIFRS